MIRHYFFTALERLGRAPVTTAANILTLALGLLAIITAWGIVSHWRSSDAEIAPAGRVVAFRTRMQFEDRTFAAPLTAAFLAKYLREDIPEFERIARFQGYGGLVEAEGRAIAVRGGQADPEFLDIFQLQFVAGDPATAMQQENSLILSQDTAARLFGDAPALGRHVVLSKQRDVVVTGVIAPLPQPSHFTTGEGALDFLGVIPPAADQRENWTGVSVVTYGLLPADGSLSQQKIDGALSRLVERRMDKEAKQRAALALGTVGVHEIPELRMNAALFGNDSELSVIAVLFGLGTLVLAIACLNYANLATAQAIGHSKEIGMRKVLGASRFAIVLQSWIEAGISTIAALVLTAVFLLFASPVIAAQMNIDIVEALLRDPRALAALGGVALAVTLAAGLYPAIIVSSVPPVEALRSGRVRSGPRGVAQALVALQFGAASVLLIAVIIVGQQNAHMRSVVLQRSADPVLIMPPSLISGVDINTLRQQLAPYPEVRSITEIGREPWGSGATHTGMSAKPSASVEERKSEIMLSVGFGYFDVYDQPPLAGRVFNEARDRPIDAPGVLPSTLDGLPTVERIVVNESFASQLGFASPQEAAGKLVYRGPYSMEIIGVVEDRPHMIQGSAGIGTMYFLDAGGSYQMPAIRLSKDNIAGGLAAVQRVWQQLAPSMPFDYKFEDEIFETNYRAFERVGRLFQTLSALAILISSIGLFGIAVHVTQRRIHEIGVRKTIGSSASRVVALLLGDFANPVIVGNLLAWPIAWYAAQAYLSSFTQRIDVGWIPFAASLVITLLIACLAVGGQTLRAASVRPAEVLRHA